jgi:hypothetical protein
MVTNDPIREGVGWILGVIAIALLFFLMYHGAELAEIVLDKLK